MFSPELGHCAGTEAHTKHLCEIQFHESLVRVVRELAIEEHHCFNTNHLENSLVRVLEIMQ
jgi:hypothetical protein